MKSNLIVTVINESEKIFRRKRTLVFLSTAVLLPLAIFFSIIFLQNKIGVLAISSAQFSYFTLNLFVGILLPLYIFAITADLFAGELQDKTLKLVLTRPITRSGVYVAKIMSVIVFNIAFLSVLLISSILASILLGGIQQLFSELPRIFLSYIVTLIPMGLIGITGVFIAQFFKNGGTALTMSILLFLGIKAVVLVIPSFAELLPFSYNDWYLYWLSGTLGLSKLLYSFVVMFSYMLIFSAIGSYFFEKKDI